MLVPVTCPKCEKQSNVPDTTLKRRIRCSGCQAIFLPAAEYAAAQPPVSWRPAPPPLPRQYEPGDEPGEPVGEPAEAAEAPFGPAAPPARFGSRVAMILGGLLMVGAGVIAAVYFNK